MLLLKSLIMAVAG